MRVAVWVRRDRDIFAAVERYAVNCARGLEPGCCVGVSRAGRGKGSGGRVTRAGESI